MSNSKLNIDAGYPLFYNTMRYEVSVSRGCYYEAYFFNSEAEARDKFTDMLVKYGPGLPILDRQVQATKGAGLPGEKGGGKEMTQELSFEITSDGGVKKGGIRNA